MDPISSFFVSGLIPNIVSSIAYDLGKAKTLPLIKSSGKPVINHHLARALFRALANCLIERLDIWKDTQPSDFSASLYKYSRGRLEQLLIEEQEKKPDWEPFVAQCNGEALSSMLSGLHQQKPADTSVIAHDSLEFLRSLLRGAEFMKTLGFSSKERQELPDSLRALVLDKEGLTLRGQLYERFREEIKRDQQTFNAFAIDFMSKIYEGVERAFPDAEMFSGSFEKIYQKIEQLPDDLARKIQESGIVLTSEQYRQNLEIFARELTARLETAHDAEKKQIEKRLTETQMALSDSRLLNQSFQERLTELHERIEHLKACTTSLPSSILPKALAALQRGDTEAARQIFQQIETQAEDTVATLAEAQYQQALMAHDRVDYASARRHIIRATQLVPDNATYLDRAGSILFELGEFDKALDCHEQALALMTAQPPDKLAYVAASLANIGTVWLAKHELGKAEDFLSQARDMWARIGYSNHLLQVSCLNSLAIVQYHQNNYDKAISAFEDVLKIQQTHLGATHADVAGTYINIGNVLSDKGECDRSLEFYEKGYAILSTTVPENRLDLARVLQNMGSLWRDKGELNKAMGFYQQAYEIRKAFFPSGHPDITSSLHNIGVLNTDLAQYDAALTNLELALKMRQSSLPACHVDIATSLDALGNLWVKKGNLDKARSYLEQSLEMRRALFTAPHKAIDNSLNNLGVLLRESGQFEEAIKFYQQALAMNMMLLPSEHPLIALSLTNIGDIFTVMGKWPEALECHERALEGIKTAFSPPHPHIVTCINNIGLTYSRMGNVDTGSKFFHDAMEMALACSPVPLPTLLAVYINLGNNHRYKEQYDNAKVAYESAFGILNKDLSHNYLLASQMLNLVGEMQCCLSKPEDGLISFERAMNLQDKYLPTDHHDRSITLYNLGRLWQIWENPDKSKFYYQQALEIMEKNLPSDHPSLQMLRDKLS